MKLLKVVRQLRKSDINPIIYGSVGVSFYLGEYEADYNDIDLLVADNYLDAGWSKLQVIMQQQNFKLIDEHEHEFSNGKLTVAFAKQSILVRDGIAASANDIIIMPFEDDRFCTLAPPAFLRAYEFSANDGYRLNQRHKKDDEVIRLLQLYLDVTEMHLNEHPFTQIANRQKTIEVRLNDKKRSRVKVGDGLTFLLRPDNKQALTVLVTKLHKAANFADLARQIDIVKTGATTKKQLVEAMLKYYSMAEQTKYGVIGIEFALLSRVALVILMGLPGSGKSYVASHLIQQGFEVVSGEEVAREMFNTEQLQPSQYDQVYNQVRERARNLLRQGKRVVIDGTNLKHEYRQQIYDTCTGFPTKLVYLRVDKTTAVQRIKEREARGEGSGCDEQTFVDFESQLEVPDSGERAIIVDALDKNLFAKIDDLL